MANQATNNPWKLASILIGLAAVVQMGGLLADIVAANRRLLEDIRARQLRAEIERLPFGSDTNAGDRSGGPALPSVAEVDR